MHDRDAATIYSRAVEPHPDATPESTHELVARLELGLEGGRRARVWVGRGAVEKLAEAWPAGCTEAALVGDETVLALHGDAIEERLAKLVPRVVRCAFPPGEAHKTRATKAAIEDALLAAEVGRHGCVVALGGGISLDVGGFVAATYLRGVRWIGIATSLLAQVDAGIGGKTAVNTPLGKNLIGAFHQPHAVLVDPDLLATLPEAEWRNGLAELAKAAVVDDAAFFAWLEAHAPELSVPSPLIDHAVARAVAIKLAIVAEDEREHGRRATLNFGHTIAHALEAATSHAFRHGDAVAIGMAVEAAVACERCGFGSDELARLVALLRALGLPVTPPDLPFAALVPFLGRDKKRRAGVSHLTLPETFGRMARHAKAYTLDVPLAVLEAAWERARGPA